MKKLIVPVVICTALFFTGFLIQIDSAVAAEITNCIPPCIAQGNVCREKVKDSPNDIEREVCQQEENECQSTCREQMKMEQELATQALEEELKEQKRKEQEQKELWDMQGYTPSQQKKMIRENKEEKDNEEEPGRNSEETPEQTVKDPEKSGFDSLNGIPVYEFK